MFPNTSIELYEKDADIAHQEFDWKITDRVNMKMCGAPESSFETWVNFSGFCTLDLV